MANSTLNKVLSDLYTDKITIKEACKILGKTREEVWNLLDSFEYFPTSEDVITACEIEKNSMRLIEHSISIENKLKSVPHILSPHAKQIIYYPRTDPQYLPGCIAYKSEIPNNVIPNNVVWNEKIELKPLVEVGCGA